MKVRIEVTFNNGRFVGFSNVEAECIEERDNMLGFRHGSRQDMAVVNMNNVNFIEYIDEELID